MTETRGANEAGKLDVQTVSKVFRRDGRIVRALDPVSVTIPEGRLISLIGPSGCGKSTLFNIIAGLLRPTTGDVLADGKSIVARPGYVAYMLQKGLLLPWRTIIENIILAAEVRGVPKRESIARAQPLIERYGLGGFEHHYPHELSGGMRQRTSLLRTMLYDRDVVLLDEPFGALDNQTRVLMQELLLGIWESAQKTVLFVTHDIDEAIFMANRVAVFSARPGRIKTEIAVDFPHPRSYTIKTSPEFMEIKARLTEEIRAESMAAAEH